MATLTIRNVPDKLLRDLKARAEKERRSLNNEALTLLESADSCHKCGGSSNKSPNAVASGKSKPSAKCATMHVNCALQLARPR